jgi:EAL domain-containing protein (putative c-di-GMP-specific phosphodiesterase class I)
VLFLEVDPRHILGVKQDHGAYFEEIITKCGLATKNIVISMTVNSFYALHYDQLLEGLNNYRQRGYQVALNVGQLYSAKGLVDFIAKLSPKYLRVNAPDIGNSDAKTALGALRDLQGLVGGQTILQQVNRKEQAAIASEVELELIQGSYYDKLSEDYLRCM